MVNAKEDVEGFLDRLAAAQGVSYSVVEPGMWIVKPGGDLDFDVVVHHSPPVILMRVKVMDLPQDSASLSSLTRRLLELNATENIHGSYGIEDEAIVMTEALEMAHLDFEEFLAAYEGITLSLASQLRELGSFREAR